MYVNKLAKRAIERHERKMLEQIHATNALGGGGLGSSRSTPRSPDTY